MYTELLDIQPRDLKFIFELKKQSSCAVRLVNKSNNYVAYKVKTTSPKRYCVRPNAGIMKPKSTCDFTVTMQAQRIAPPDMICKDKFLVQSTIVPVETTDEDITSSMFGKDDGKYVEESKMRVILVSPPHSPVLSPINGTLNPVPAYEASILKDQLLSTVESLTPHHTVTQNVEESKMENGEELKAAKDVEFNAMKNVEELEELKPAKDVEFNATNDVEERKEVKPAKDVEFNAMKDVEEPELVKDVEEMKSKLNELESKLSKAEFTISKLTEERRLATQERESLRQELALLKSKRGARRVQAGFPLLFVCMVVLIGVMLGYLLHW
uniref:Putative vesicle-associated protein 2-2 n=1 Tax=Davidia involucrata TaxID=16924 RepID=A0A5B6YL37_DAVIN